MNSINYRGKTALVTGASSGIGAEFAKALAARGANVILVARTEAPMLALAKELTGKAHINADVVSADLSVPGAVDRLIAEIGRRGLQVDILVNNAGFATHGLFDAIPKDRQRDEIQVNVTALVELAHAVLSGMKARGAGIIVNVASTAAFQPDPFMAVYGATKAFVLSFSEALWAEYRPLGVQILALCPGATETPFFDVVGAAEASVGRRDTVQNVVATAFRALERGRSFVIPGRQNNLLATLHRVLPRQRLTGMVANMLKPRTA